MNLSQRFAIEGRGRREHDPGQAYPIVLKHLHIDGPVQVDNKISKPAQGVEILRSTFHQQPIPGLHDFIRLWGQLRLAVPLNAQDRETEGIAQSAGLQAFAREARSLGDF